MQSVTGPGHVVAGRYELLGVIGHGAMGTVWRAADRVLAREVAVKEVRLPGPISPQDRAVARERSMREARVAARLTHPGVVTVHDVIESGDSPWIVMELVPARSLAQVVAQDGPLSPARAAEMGMVLLDALGSAHAVGIVHRDVKPGNVLITAGGRAVLTDFGIATVAGDPGLTQAGMVMGTPGFCAPERIRGAPASPASDLWSLGATLYAAVEGRAPFDGQGSAMAVLSIIVHGDPPPPAAAGTLAPVITALMCRDPAARPDATAARKMLTAACQGETARPATAGPLGAAGQLGAAGSLGAAGQYGVVGPPGAADLPGTAGQYGVVGPAGEPWVPPAADATMAFPQNGRQPSPVPPENVRTPGDAGTPGNAGLGGPAELGPRRPGRHRRGLLLGGGGAAAQ